MFELLKWKRDRLETDRSSAFRGKGRDDVTVVAYAFNLPDKMPECVESIELALRETYRWCGFMKTTLVVNQMTNRLERMKSEFGSEFRIDVDASLVPGDIVGFSRNMIRTLPSRFDTPYMLNIHPDGFPLRRGLDDFIGRWDFIGGPWNVATDDFITKILLSRNNGAGNGGFALRSRKICELGAAAYRRFWKIIPDCYLLYEDVFFTRFLTRWQPGYARQIAFAPRSESLRFSVADALSLSEHLKSTPFGFHSWHVFCGLQAAGLTTG